MHAFLLLIEPLRYDVGDVPAAERLLEFFLAGGVDALSDEHGGLPSADFYGMRVGRYDGRLFLCDGEGRALLRGVDSAADVFRGGAAAASQYVGAVGRYVRHEGGELLCGHVVDRLAVLAAGKPGVRVHDDGDACRGRKAWHKRRHLLRSQRAIHAERRHAEPLKDGRHGLRVGAGQQPSLGVVDRCHEDGHGEPQLLHSLLCRDDSRLCLVAVVHRLDKHGIYSA